MQGQKEKLQKGWGWSGKQYFIFECLFGAE